MIIQKPTSEWTKWFAWYPVTTTEEQFIWLDFVLRKKMVISGNIVVVIYKIISKSNAPRI